MNAFAADTPDFAGRPLVYLAAPYSKGDQVENVRRAVLAAEALHHHFRVTTYVPHVSMLWHLVSPHGPEHWYAWDLALLRRCDALFRLEGESTGADAEVEYARRWGLPVFTCEDDLGKWALRWESDRRSGRAKTLHDAADHLERGRVRPILAERLRAMAGARP